MLCTSCPLLVYSHKMNIWYICISQALTMTDAFEHVADPIDRKVQVQVLLSGRNPG